MSSAGNNLVVSVDLGGTNMQMAVIEFSDDSYTFHGRHWCRTQASEGQDAVIERMVSGLEAACSDAGLPRESVRAVGVAAAGAIDVPSGIVLESPNLEWEDLPLRDILQERLGLPVALDNDVNAAVWAEHQRGAGRGHSELLGVWVGTGVGGGLVIDNRLYHGPMFTAGEIGHTVIMPEDRPGKRTVEELCSRTGMSDLIDRKIHEFHKSILHHRVEAEEELEPIEMSLLAKAFEEGDPLVKRTVQRSAKMLGVAIANWVTVLSLDCVVLGGGVVESLGRGYVARIGASFNANVFPERLRRCKLMTTELAGDAGLVGAALLARAAVVEETAK